MGDGWRQEGKGGPARLARIAWRVHQSAQGRRRTRCTRLAALAIAELCLAGTLVCDVAALGIPTDNALAACVNESLRTGVSARLPDCRAYEQISPTAKVTGTTNAGEAPFTLGVDFQAAASGASLFYTASNALAGSPAGGATYYLGTREKAGWRTTPLSPPSLLGNIVLTGHYAWLSPELSCDIAESPEPLTADTPAADVAAETVNLYRRNPDDSWTLLTTAVPLNVKAKDGYYVWGASADCERVIFATNARVLSDAPEAEGALSLYEYDDGALRIVDHLPDGTVPSEGISSGFADSGLESPWNVVTQEGVRVLFTANSDEGAESGYREVFLRQGSGSSAAKTIEVSRSLTSTPDNGAEFQAASQRDGRVFFIANYGLTSLSSTGATFCSAEGEGCDLYEYDAESGVLTDLSVDHNGADGTGADVAGVLGISEDGSDVYFAAAGQLVAGDGNTQADNQALEQRNLYLEHEGRLAFVGTITSREASNETTGAALLTNFAEYSSRVTSDGKHLLFVSQTSVTGYDNTQASIFEPQAAEVYLYSSESGRTVCVSCDPSDAAPVPREGAEREPIAEPRWFPLGTSAVPRALSEDGGRVYFESPDPLATQAKSGQMNVYEWERAGEGSCTTASAQYSPTSGGCQFLIDSGASGDPGEGSAATFLDATASGDDVFIATTSQLAPTDTDNLSDVYDVRVGGGFPTPALSAGECEGGACQGAAAGAGVFAPPSSALLSGAGNLRHHAAKPRGRRLRKRRLGERKRYRAAASCKRRYKRSARRRRACQRRARLRTADKAYGGARHHKTGSVQGRVHWRKNAPKRGRRGR